MSKSSGEFLTVSLLKEKGYSPLDYRYFCLNSHYRNPLVFSYESLDIAKQAFTKLKSKVRALLKEGEIFEEHVLSYMNEFKDAFSNDINTSLMLTVLYDVLKDSTLNDATKYYLVEKMDAILSLNLTVFEDVSIPSSLEDKILKKIDERNIAKKNKDFLKADTIRDELLEMRVRLIDTREGTKYELI